MTATNSAEVDRPVYEFRPLPNDFNAPFRRYANGKWIDDDGEYDIAFISGVGFGPPIYLYIKHGYQRNIVSQWLEGSWQGYEPRHPRMNPWHYALADGETEWGGGCGSDAYENNRVSWQAANKLCSESRCANGRPISITNAIEPHVAAGLVRRRDTKEVLSPVEGRCMYCGDSNADAIAKATGATQ